MKAFKVFLAGFCFTSYSLVNAQQHTNILDTSYTPRAGVFEGVSTRLPHSSNELSVCEFGHSIDSLKGIIEKDLPKELSKYLKGMKFILGGRHVVHCSENIRPTANDSTLLFFNHAKIINNTSFLIGENEVTNIEYREFTDWVKDSVARAFLALKNPKYYLNQTTKQLNKNLAIDWSDSLLFEYIHIKESERFYKRREVNTKLLNYSYVDNSGRDITLNIYPDTTRWTEDFPFSFNEPMTQMYFWHPAYDNYPAVCVSWQQAQAYCHWKTEQLKHLLKQNNLQSIAFGDFRLPENVEWEYAAVGDKDENLDATLYPWNDANLVNKSGKYYANFGIIRDVNNVVDKWYVDDGAFHTIVVSHFPANSEGLYDMAGNIAEWTKDVPQPISLKDYFCCSLSIDTLLPAADYTITEKDDIHSILRRIVKINKMIPGEHQYIDTVYDPGRKRIINDVADLLHDWKVMQNRQALRIVKGGSWADPPLYMQSGLSEIFPESKSSCRIGFRQAMTLTDDMLPYFYRKAVIENKRKQIVKENLKKKKSGNWRRLD